MFGRVYPGDLSTDCWSYSENKQCTTYLLTCFCLKQFIQGFPKDGHGQHLLQNLNFTFRSAWSYNILVLSWTDWCLNWCIHFIYIWKSDLKSMIDLTEHRTENFFQIIDPQLEVLWAKFTKWYPCLCIHLDIQATKMNTNTCLTLTFIMNVGHSDLIKIAGRKADNPARLCNL